MCVCVCVWVCFESFCPGDRNSIPAHVIPKIKKKKGFDISLLNNQCNEVLIKRKGKGVVP